ncbi:MAG: neutral zinc metallopeptidase [Marmoricola sp.]
MRFNPRATSDSSGTSERSGGGGGFPGLGGGGGGGRLTIGGVVVAGVIFLVAQLTGVDVTGLVNGSGGGGGDQTGQGVSCTGAQANASSDDSCAISLITDSVQDFWKRTLPDQADGTAYQKIQTIEFSGSTSSGCGQAQSAMGPFYCPNDKRVYIDTDFMHDMLTGQLGAKGGPFALGYVIGHEYGHHIEDQLGLLAKMRTQQGPRSDSVKAELMADCLGGMWAKAAEQTTDSAGNAIIEDVTSDDVSRAIDAAHAVGDDRIQQESGGGVDQESWTHGSSAQREHWFTVGFQGGSLSDCNTFAAGAL